MNCIEWNEEGNILLSGSDDRTIMLWDVYKQKAICKLDTTHHGNVFSVKFMPLCDDNVAVSSAADNKICVYDLRTKTLLHELTPHVNRVKRLAVAHDTPHVFWSGGEDGLIMQHDIRCPTNQASNILIDYSACNVKSDKHAPGAFNEALEVKCLDISRLRSELLAVGCNDPFARSIFFNRCKYIYRCLNSILERREEFLKPGEFSIKTEMNLNSQLGHQSRMV